MRVTQSTQTQSHPNIYSINENLSSITKFIFQGESKCNQCITTLNDFYMKHFVLFLQDYKRAIRFAPVHDLFTSRFPHNSLKLILQINIFDIKHFF